MTPTTVSYGAQKPTPSRKRAGTLPPLAGRGRTSSQSQRTNPAVEPDPGACTDELHSFQSIAVETAPLGKNLHREKTRDPTSLNRHGTLLSSGATPLKRTVELRSLLGNNKSRLPPGASVLKQHCEQDLTHLEQAKPRARVEVDIMLHSNVCVEGGVLEGVIKLRIRPCKTTESTVSISDGKIRILGFETVSGDYHEFFQHSTSFSAVVTSLTGIYASRPDSEGFCRAQDGLHKMNFKMQLPISTARRPKGPFNGPSGAAIRYIALVSIKVKDEFSKRSIAHFYRDCEIWPRLDPSAMLAPAQHPIKATKSKSLFMGGSGQVHLTAALHRSTFVAGSRVNVNICVKNETKKIIKGLTLTLFMSTVLSKRTPQAKSTAAEIDMDKCQTTSNKKAVAMSTLEMAKGFPKAHSTNDGWWAGIHGGERSNFSHFILVPPEALTLTGGALIEVTYTIRVSLHTGSLTSDLWVDLPIYIVNFLSLDPP
ncbi:immunoglobulin E-set, partial [Favolaschia claudopus]